MKFFNNINYIILPLKKYFHNRYRNFRTTVLSNANNEVLTRAEYYKNEDSSDEVLILFVYHIKILVNLKLERKTQI